MTPAQAAKQMAEWGDMFEQSSMQLSRLDNAEQRTETLDRRATELQAVIDKIVADTATARAVHKWELENWETDTRGLMTDRKAALAEAEAVHKNSIAQANAHQAELMQRMETERAALKSEIETLAVQKSTLATDVGNLRAIIKDFASR